MAHELNNPLTSIKSFIQLMLLDEQEDEDREALEIMKREADRMAKIVADLRQVSRATDAGKRERHPVDISDAVRHVVRLRRYALETGNVVLDEELASDLPPVLADRGQVEQILLNLVLNAEQAMAGAPERRLVVRTRRSVRGATIEVSDTGRGIPAEHLERIFDPFFTTKAPGEGTGLGLSLVHSVVAEYQGEIRVESRPGSGATFFVELPAAERAGTTSPLPSGDGVSTRRLQVLVVDDEPSIRRAMVRYLGRRGHTVHEASDGAAALQMLDQNSYNVVLSDLRMPGLGGDVLLERLSARAFGGRVILITGDAFGANLDPRLGVPVLLKPVELHEVARAVEEESPGSS